MTAISPPRRKPRRARPVKPSAPAPAAPAPSAAATYARAARVHTYARDVLSGRITAGHLVRAACRRHLADLAATGLDEHATPLAPPPAPGPGSSLLWHPAEAETWIEFFEDVLHLKPGHPFKLEPFQAFIVGSIFGWYRKDPDNPGTIVRRFRTAYVEIGKGNGKTPMAAGIGLGGLIVDAEHRPEIYSAAAAKEQAKICFDDAVAMAAASPQLHGLLEVLTHSITHQRAGAPGVFRPLSSEDKGQHGKRVHMALLDEIHAHATGAMARAITAGTKNCRNALILIITNSGKRAKSSTCWSYHETARKILEGSLHKDDFFAYVCTLDPCPACYGSGYRQPNLECPRCDQYTDPATWVKANPGLGTICRTGYVRERVATGRAMPSELNDVLQLNLCMWTESNTSWANMAAWNTLCHRPGLTWASLAGRPASVAMDAANKVDATSLVAVFEAAPGAGKLDPAALDLAAQTALAAALADAPQGAETLGEKIRALSAAGYHCIHRCFVPQAMVDNATGANHEHYTKWQRAGKLIVTPGARTDFGRIMEELALWRAHFPIRRFSFDPREMSYFVQQIQLQPWCDFPLVEVLQSPQMISQPMKELEALIAAGLMGHDGDEVLAWMLGNVVQKTAQGGGPRKYYFPGREADENKIDGAAALIMALDGLVRAAPPLADPGIVFL
jgi:phage terminase large subunit-like protein